MDWPHMTVPVTPESFTTAVLGRANRSSALWQQTGFLCDVIIPSDDGSARYYEELPAGYIDSGTLGNHTDYYTLSLDFGNDITDQIRDPLAVHSVHKDDVADATLPTGIHPIIRRHVDGRLHSTHHVIEDIECEWTEEVHRRPLTEYFRRQLATTEAVTGSRMTRTTS